MTRDDEEPVVEAPASARQPKISLVIVLSLLLGILLTIMAIGGFVLYQRAKTIETELRTARSDLNKKNTELVEMGGQIEALSLQMQMLKDYSIARSGAGGGKNKSSGTPSSPDVSSASAQASALPEGKRAEPTTTLPGEAGEKPAKKPVKPKSPALNCELVGKTPEEQAMTLQRCVGVMDGAGKEKRSR